MDSRKAPTSKKVRCPDTSMKVTWSRWLIFTEKLTRNNLSAGMASITRACGKGCGGICGFQKMSIPKSIAARPQTGHGATTPRVRRAQLPFGDSDSAGESPLQDESEVQARPDTRQAERTAAARRKNNRSVENPPAQDGG